MQKNIYLYSTRQKVGPREVINGQESFTFQTNRIRFSLGLKEKLNLSAFNVALNLMIKINT